MKKLYCETCTNNCLMTIMSGGPGIVVDGNDCLKGYDFAEQWMSDTKRMLTTTVRTKIPDVPVLSVRTEEPIPKNTVSDAMHEINAMIVEQELGCGETLIESVAGTGVKVIVTSSVLMNLGAELENKNEQITKTAAGSGGGVAMSGAASAGGVRNVATIKVLDDMGMDAADGFVGAAGAAVGVESSEDVTDGDDAADDSTKSKEPHFAKKGRAQINRK